MNKKQTVCLGVTVAGVVLVACSIYLLDRMMEGATESGKVLRGVDPGNGLVEAIFFMFVVVAILSALAPIAAAIYMIGAIGVIILSGTLVTSTVYLWIGLGTKGLARKWYGIPMMLLAVGAVLFWTNVVLDGKLMQATASFLGQPLTALVIFK